MSLPDFLKPKKQTNPVKEAADKAKQEADAKKKAPKKSTGKPTGGTVYEKPIGPVKPALKKVEPPKSELDKIKDTFEPVKSLSDYFQKYVPDLPGLDVTARELSGMSKAQRDNYLAKKRAEKGDTETLTQKKIRTPGTYEYAVAQARAKLNIKEGSEEDKILKSAMWMARSRKDDFTPNERVVVTAEDYNRVVKQLETVEGKAKVLQDAQAYREQYDLAQNRPSIAPATQEMRRQYESNKALEESGVARIVQNVDEFAKDFSETPAAKFLGKIVGAGVTLSPIELLAPGSAKKAEEMTTGLAGELAATPGRIFQNLFTLISPGAVAPEKRIESAAMLLLDVGLSAPVDIARGIAKGGKLMLASELAQAAQKAGATIDEAADIAQQIVKLPDELIDDAIKTLPDDVRAKFEPKVDPNYPAGETPDLVKLADENLASDPFATPDAGPDVSTVPKVQEPGSIPGGSTSVPEATRKFGANNKLVTPDDLADAIAILKKPSSGGLGSGLGGFSKEDADRLGALAKVVAFYVEGGVREAGAIIKRAADELGITLSKNDVDNALDDLRNEGFPIADRETRAAALRALDGDPAIVADPFGDTPENVLDELRQIIKPRDGESLEDALIRFQENLQQSSFDTGNRIDIEKDAIQSLKHGDAGKGWSGTPWRKLPNGNWVPMKGVKRGFVGVTKDNYLDSPSAWNEVIRIAEQMDEGLIYTDPRVAADYIPSGKRAGMGGNQSVPRNGLRISEVIWQEALDMDTFLRQDNYSEIMVPHSAIKEYLKQARRYVKTAERETVEKILAKHGVSYDEYEEAISHHAKELSKPAKRNSPSQKGSKNSGRNTKGTAKRSGQIKKPPVLKGEPDFRATGLANQVQEREALDGIIGQVAPSEGKGAKHWQQVGREAVESGEDYIKLAEDVATGNAPFTADNVGILLEGKRLQLQEIAKLAKQADADPIKYGDQLLEARANLQTYLENVQAGKGAWSDAGRALQAGTNINYGNFEEVLQEMTRGGLKVSEKQAKELKAATEKISELEQKVAELEKAKNGERAKEAVRTANRSTKKEKIVQEIEDIFKEFGEVQKSGPGMGSKKRGAANLITADDIKVAKKQAELIKRLAIAYAKMGAATLEEVVQKVQAAFRDRFGIDIEAQAVIDAMASQGETRSRSELVKQLNELKREARRLSSGNVERLKDQTISKQAAKNLNEATSKLKRLEQVKQDIVGLQKQIDEGRYAIRQPNSTKSKTIDRELEDLLAERRILRKKIDRAIADQYQNKLVKGAQTVLDITKGAQLGADFGVLTRQGLFSWARPKAAGRGVRNAVEAMLSERGAARVENLIENRVVNGRKVAPIRAQANLSLTTGNLNDAEELFFLRAIKRIPGLGKLSGVLERGQAAFINTVRSDIFDSAIKAGLDADELALRAKFINNVTGRGNIKQVPQAMQFIMTSPRYEASRWSTLGEPLRNLGRLGWDAASKGKMNRAALMNLQDMVVTAGSVYGIFKLAELGGYEVNFDPQSSDFLKMRRGDDVWDVSAGLAPRLRDILRFYAVWDEGGEYAQNLLKVLGGAGTRPLSPAIITPLNISSATKQRSAGKMEPTNLQGFPIESDNTWQDFYMLSPLIVQSFRSTYKKEGPEEATWAAVREFLGGSTQRYPKR